MLHAGRKKTGNVLQVNLEMANDLKYPGRRALV